MRKKTNRVGRPKASTASLEARRMILGAALDLFADRSFAAVTTKDIAEATGLNTALIYYYFGSKEDLFRSAVSMAVERAFDRFRLARTTANEPRKIILSWIDTHIREYETIAKLIKIAVGYASTGDRKVKIDEAIANFYDGERDVLRSALKAGIARRDFGPLDVEETATFISTYLDGVFVRAIILKDFEPIAAIGELKTFLKVRLAAPDKELKTQRRA